MRYHNAKHLGDFDRRPHKNDYFEYFFYFFGVLDFIVIVLAFFCTFPYIHFPKNSAPNSFGFIFLPICISSFFLWFIAWLLVISPISRKWFAYSMFISLFIVVWFQYLAGTHS